MGSYYEDKLYLSNRGKEKGNQVDIGNLHLNLPMWYQ